MIKLTLHELIVIWSFLIVFFEIMKSFVVPLVAVYLGARFAYVYQDNLRKKSTSEEHIAIITKTYLTVMKQMNQLAVMATQFCDEIVMDEQVAALPFDYRFTDYLDDSDLSCVALVDGDLYRIIQEANNGYDVVLTLIDRYNQILQSKNEYYLFNSLGAILDKSLQVIAHDQTVLARIHAFVVKQYGRENYLKTTLPAFDAAMIRARLERIKLRVVELEKSGSGTE